VGDYVEATSPTLLESMGLGVATIATNIGGLKDVLNGSEAGILVPPSDTEALASAMDRVATDQGLRGELGKKGMEFVESKFSSRIWFKKLLRIYLSD